MLEGHGRVDPAVLRATGEPEFAFRLNKFVAPGKKNYSLMNAKHDSEPTIKSIDLRHGLAVLLAARVDIDIPRAPAVRFEIGAEAK